MKKVLIFGATGMLGHKLYQVLKPSCDVVGTIRSGYKIISRYSFLEPTILIPRFDATQPNAARQVIESIRPDIVINCIGVISTKIDKAGIPAMTYLNAEFPHEVLRICQPKGIRLIHISTDGVFSGKKGNYKEDDPSDAEDIYGKTKYQGEVSGPGALTIRTSFIGRELQNTSGLLEELIAKRGGEAEGWTNDIYSGYPTLYLSRIIAAIIENHQDLTGLYHVSSEPISKYDLLALINTALTLNIAIKPTPEPRINRSLDSTHFRNDTGFSPIAWEVMVKELAGDAAQYDKWR